MARKRTDPSAAYDVKRLDAFCDTVRKMTVEDIRAFSPEQLKRLRVLFDQFDPHAPAGTSQEREEVADETAAAPARLPRSKRPRANADDRLH